MQNLPCVVSFMQAPKLKYRVDRGKLMEFMKINGLPPKKASCIGSGYWVQAAKAACNVKSATKKLAKAVSSYWHGNVQKFRQMVEYEIVSNITAQFAYCYYYVQRDEEVNEGEVTSNL